MIRIWKQAGMQHFLRGLAGLGLLGALGCGGNKAPQDVVQYYGNYHPTTWINEHPGKAVAGVEACTKCHELSVLRVGSGVPTCMTTGCHHQTVPTWANPEIHGGKAKLALSAAGGSLVSCQICHGKDFAGGTSAKACSTCHTVQAPHPTAPWRSSAGTLWTHTTTDTSNAITCAQCHHFGSPNNPAGHPAAPPAAGAQPGCFNATLCHASVGAPHAMGAIWTDPTSSAFHGVEAKKDLKYCQGCHGTPGTTKFDGGLASTACSSCHSKTTGAGAHPTTWYRAGVLTFPGYVPSHRNATDPLNAAGGCALCHAVTKAGTSPLTAAPSCFSTSFGNGEHAAVSCHANGPGVAPHLVGATWTDPRNAGTTDATFHGLEAKKDLLSCQTCHGVPGTNKFDSGAASTTCSSCHTQAKAHPDVWSKSASSFSSGNYAASHRTAADAIDTAKRAAVCGLCHTVTAAGGTPPMAGAPGCFSASFNTVGCHANGPGAAAHPAPFLTGLTTTTGTLNTHQNATPAQFAAECITCHDETGPGAGKSGPSCTVCHIAGSPLAAGKGPGTCASCHSDATFKTLGPTTVAAYPNVPGAHAKHLGLPASNGIACATCHAGSMPGEGGANQPHYTGANRGPNGTATGKGYGNVTLSTTFKAMTGTLSTTPSPTAFTCAAVSCHGGQTTPGWQSGKLVVNGSTYCMSCHKVAAAASQYNDATGRHANPGQHNVACSTCHDMTQAKPGAQNHFKYLHTTAVSGVSGTPADQYPSDTIRFDTSIVFSNGTGPSYTASPQGQGYCTLTCHSGGEQHDSGRHWN
jgi:predicted CxxxxCH...CXXCH cytochrome family protein